MSNWKTILVMLGLVAMGFAAGFGTNRYLTHQYFEKVKKIRGEKDMTEHLLRVIKADEVQKKKVRPIIENYSQELYENWNSYKQKRLELYDSLKMEIIPELKPKQVKRLERFIKFRKKKKRKKKK